MVTLDVLILTGFYSRDLLNLKITQALLDLGWGEIWSGLVLVQYFFISYTFLNIDSGILTKSTPKTCMLLYSHERCLGDVFLAAMRVVNFLHLPHLRIKE